MATVAEHPYEETLNGLAIAIRRLRRDCPPRELARQILTYDNPGHTHLVGIDYVGERVTCYHCEEQYAIAVEIGADGLARGAEYRPVRESRGGREAVGQQAAELLGMGPPEVPVVRGVRVFLPRPHPSPHVRP